MLEKYIHGTYYSEGTYQSLRYKLDGVGPVENRPSTDKLYQFVQEEEEEKIYDHM